MLLKESEPWLDGAGGSGTWLYPTSEGRPIGAATRLKR